MKYTKGEWKVVGFLGEHEEMGAVIKSGDKVIGHTAGGLRYHSKPEEWGEYRANAQLIAAAPRMHSLLATLWEWLNEEPRGLESDRPGLLDEWANILDTIAEGRTQ